MNTQNRIYLGFQLGRGLDFTAKSNFQWIPFLNFLMHNILDMTENPIPPVLRSRMLSDVGSETAKIQSAAMLQEPSLMGMLR